MMDFVAVCMAAVMLDTWAVWFTVISCQGSCSRQSNVRDGHDKGSHVIQNLYVPIQDSLIRQWGKPYHPSPPSQQLSILLWSNLPQFGFSSCHHPFCCWVTQTSQQPCMRIEFDRYWSDFVVHKQTTSDIVDKQISWQKVSQSVLDTPKTVGQLSTMLASRHRKWRSSLFSRSSALNFAWVARWSHWFWFYPQHMTAIIRLRGFTHVLVGTNNQI